MVAVTRGRVVDTKRDHSARAPRPLDPAVRRTEQPREDVAQTRKHSFASFPSAGAMFY
jgi:hypothetical protein